MAQEIDPTLRFTSRVDNYVRYRPGYPREIISTLSAECGLTPQSVVADIGCGPGNLARLFLENGNTVIGVEPNGPMREAGRRELAQMGSCFVLIDARAEDTGLAPASVDLIVAGQAFHWFDAERARAEFQRILRKGGWCAFIWNEHRGNSPFLQEYDRLLLHYGTDYASVRSKFDAPPELERFFTPQPVHRREFAYRQDFDFEGLTGRLVSSSYSPQPSDTVYAPMLLSLREIYDRHAQDGSVAFEYQTFLYYAQLGG